MFKTKFKIEKFGGEGVGIGHIDGKVVFVSYAVPGDEISAKIYHETKDYYKAELLDVIEPSPERVEAPCEYFGVCGGCSHQNMPYSAQLKHKRELLCEIFRRHLKGGLEVPEVVSSPDVFGYRNKLQMQCATGKGGKLVAGFYRIRSHSVVEIARCPLHSDRINKLVQSVVSILNQFKIPAYNEDTRRGMVRHIVVRESRRTGEMLLTIVSKYPTLLNQNRISRVLFRENRNLKGFFVYHNPHDTNVIFEDGENARANASRSPLKKVFGEDFIEDELCGVRFKISPLSFFQVNTLQAENMARHISGLIGERARPEESLIDAYAGIGTLSLGLAPRFKTVLAAEIVSQACTLARLNARSAGAKNYVIRRGDALEEIEKIVDDLGADAFDEAYPAIILDPPRAGISKEMTEFLCERRFREIIYVSCNPMTQVRDVEAILKTGRYRIASIAPFDMFPHTFHVENIVRLERKSGKNE